MKKYDNELQHFELLFKDRRSLSREELRILIERYKEGDKEAGKKIIENNFVWIVKILTFYVKKYRKSYGELIGPGVTGMYKAIKEFNFDLGYSFTTYSRWWIRNFVGRQLFRDKIVPLPYNIKKKIPICFMSLDSEREFQRNESLKDYIIEKYKQNVSNYTKNSNKDHLLFDSIARYLEGIPQRERRIIIMYYGLDGRRCKNLEEIGKLYGLSRERIRQILEEQYQKMRYSKKIRQLRKEFLKS